MSPGTGDEGVAKEKYIPILLVALYHGRICTEAGTPLPVCARPLIDALLACLEESVDKVPNKSKIAIAIRYVLAHRTYRSNYLLDGNCSILHLIVNTAYNGTLFMPSS